MAKGVLRIRIVGDKDDLKNTLDGAAEDLSTFGKGLKATGAVIGAAAGATLATGFAKSLDMGEAQGKLNAQLGVTGERAEELGRIAGSLYSSAYGDSLGQVNDAVRSVIQSGAVMEDASNAQLESVTGKVINLATAFEQDLGESARAVGNMIKTGMAPDAEHALNIITRAFEQGNNIGGDLLETINEYGVQFQKLGLDGSTAMGLISQSLKAGARDSDFVVDALKEFALLVPASAKPAQDAYRALGLDARQMAADVAAGGPSAAAALDLTLDKLRELEDPVQRDAAAIALFGAKAEDLQGALLALDPSSAGKALGEVAGATDRTAAALTTAKTRVIDMQRDVELWTASLITAQGPLGTVATATAAYGGQALSVVGPLATMIAAQRAASAASAVAAATQASAATATSTSWLVASTATVASWVRMSVAATLNAVRIAAAWVLGVGLGAGAAVAGMIAASVVIVGRWVWMGAQATAQALRMAAAWFIALGPLGWVIAAVVGVVALIIGYWDEISGWTSQKWQEITGWIRGNADEITRVITTLARIGLAIMTGGLSELVLLVIRRWDEITGFVSSVPGRIRGALGNLGGLLWDAGIALISGFWDGLVARWNALLSWARGAMASLRALFPFSPAKEGPFAGRGYVTYSGQALVKDWAAALRAGLPRVLASARELMSATRGELTQLGPVDLGELMASAESSARAQLVALTGQGAREALPSATAGGQTVRVIFDVDGADGDLKRLFRRAVRTEARGSAERFFQGAR